MRFPRIPRRAFRLICAPPEPVPVCLLTEAGWGGVNCLYLPVYGRHSVKRFLICGLLSVLFLSGLCAGPFGLSMGEYVVYPEKTHSAFERYFVRVDEEAGLYAIGAESSAIPDDGYGETVKARFYSVAESISKTYGEPEITDAYWGERGVFDGDSNWMTQLIRGHRVLDAVWWAESKEDLLPGDVVYIGLYTVGFYSAKSTSGYAGALLLTYSFANRATVAEQEENVF